MPVTSSIAKCRLISSPLSAFFQATSMTTSPCFRRMPSGNVTTTRISAGFIVSGFGMPSRDDVDVITALEGIPGSIIGMGIIWFIGSARERAEPAI